jgi:hypothetical protein
MKTRIAITALGLFFVVGLVAGFLFPQSTTSANTAEAGVEQTVKSEGSLGRTGDLIADTDGPIVGFATVMLFTGIGIGAGVLLGLHLRVEDTPMPRRQPIKRFR